MLDVIDFERFLQDLNSYIIQRIPDSRWLDVFLRINRNKQLRESILALADDDIPTNELLEPEYALCVAVYQNNEERVSKIHEAYFKEGFSRLQVFLLAYDAESRKFNTNYLLIRLADLINKNIIPNFSASIFSDRGSHGFISNNELYSDYDVQHAINLVNVIWEREGSKEANLPINMLFAVPYPNELLYQFGLRLLNEGGLDPLDILCQARPPKNNDYRLLNHCVERLVQENRFSTDDALQHCYRDYLDRRLWPSILSFVPAALYYRNRNDDRIQAAKMGYKLAMTHCVVNNLQYTTSINLGLRDVHDLWIENYISNDQFFVAIMAMEPKIVRESLTLRAFLLSELCVSKGWTFLAEVFYAYISGLTNFELLTTAEFISIIMNCQLYKRPALAATLLTRLMWRELSDDEKQIAAMLQDKECASYAFHDYPLILERFSLASKFSAMPVTLEALCKVMQHFMSLSFAEAKVLSSWIENSYGRYIVEWFATLYLTTGSQLNKDEIFNAVVKNTLLQYAPNTITVKQLEEVHSMIDVYMPDNFKFQEAYNILKYDIDHRDEINSENNEYKKLLRVCRDLTAELDTHQATVSQDIVVGMGMLSITARNNASVSDLRNNVNQLHKKLVNEGMTADEGRRSLIKLVNDYILRIKENSVYLLAQINKFFGLAEDNQLSHALLVQRMQQYIIVDVEGASVNADEQPRSAADAALVCSGPAR